MIYVPSLYPIFLSISSPLTLSLFAPFISLLRSEEVGVPSNNVSPLFIPDSFGTVIGPPPFTVVRSLSILPIFQFLRGSSFHAVPYLSPVPINELRIMWWEYDRSRCGDYKDKNRIESSTRKMMSNAESSSIMRKLWNNMAFTELYCLWISSPSSLFLPPIGISAYCLFSLLFPSLARLISLLIPLSSSSISCLLCTPA